MKIASILPYKENYTKQGAGAVALWISDFMRDSIYKRNTFVFGNTKNKNFLTKNYTNINISNVNSRLNSTTKEYSSKIIKKIKTINFDIIELHNRPIMVKEFFKKIDSKIILYFHNDPTTMKGAKSIGERMYLLENVDKIIFISEWVKKRFFKDLPELSDNKTQVIYHSIDPVKVNVKKKKNIIFVGKLNESKGYDLYCKSMFNILNKNKDWKAYSIGEEKRFQNFPTHKRHLNLGQISHNKVLDFLSKSEIAVIPSRWEEPFGRTAMESAAYGCATITSNRGGLVETFDNKLILKKLSSNEIIKKINYLIKKPKKLKKYQKENFQNPKHSLDVLCKYLDSVKLNLLDKTINILKSNGPRILHISNFNEKNNHRLFNISIASKLTNGFIRNKCDVINFSYRNYLSNNFFPKLDEDVLDICNNYKPDLVLLGHNNILKKNTLEKIKENKSKINLWYEDHVVNYGPNWKNNLNLIEKNHQLIDNYFITTHPSEIKTKINKKKINYLPIPVDPNIENLKIYENKYRYKDLFFALSHGVNYGGLRNRSKDEREEFLKNLININESIKFHILGINQDIPKWNFNFYKEISFCKMALNLSRGRPLKYATSNRIASYVGNGILTFIDEKVKFQNLFNHDELVTYKNESDLIEKILALKDDTKKINKISKKGKERYFEIFDNSIIADSIISESLNMTPKFNYVWKK